MESRLIIYKASAGTGKTFTLAANYISYLLASPEAYRRLLAVTFTNKATGEMKERIISQLYGISRGLPESDSYLAAARRKLVSDGRLPKEPKDGEEERLRTNAGRALTSILHNYSAFRIETIDSFMVGILRGLAKELELGHNLDIELDAKRIVSEGVHDFIAGQRLDSPAMGAIISYIERNIENEQRWDVEGKLTSFGENLYREAYLRHSEELDALLREHPDTFVSLRRGLDARERKASGDKKTVTESFFALCDRLGAKEDDFNGKRNSPYGLFEKARQGLTPEVSLTRRQYAMGEKAWGNTRSPLRNAIDAEDGTFSTMLATLIRIIEEENTIALVRKNLYQLQLIGGIETQIRENCRRDGRFMLADTCLMLMRMASGPGDTAFIYEKTGTEIDHILIDEFQDTSGLQWDNFRPLLQENAARGHQGLIVGDVKQAIYRWRDSNADIMARQVDVDMQTAEPKTETLTINRRSRREIVDFNSRFFTNLVGRLGDADLIHAYADVRQESLPGKEGGCVRIIETDTDQMAAEVAVQIRELLDGGVPQSGIAILTRFNKQIGELARWFDAHPEAVAPHEVRLVSGEAFILESSAAVRLLIGAMRWVSNGDDAVALAQVGIAWHRDVLADGLSVTDILNLPDGHYGLPEAFVNGELAALPLGTLTYALYDLLGVGSMEGQDAWLQGFTDIVQHYAAEKSATPAEFLKEWDEKIYKKAIPSGEAEGITCMTIHRAKGLEFHTVIIPYCDWPVSGKQTTLWVETEATDYEGLTCLPIDTESTTMPNSRFADAYNEEKRQLRQDNVNLLYVAFTRPTTNLIVIKKPSGREGKNVSAYIDMGLEGLARDEGARDEGARDEGARLDMTLPPAPEKTENPLIVRQEPIDVGFHAADIRLPFRQSNSSRTYINRGDDSPMSEFIERGNLLHEVFAHIATASDAPRAVAELFTQGIVTAEERDEIQKTVEEALRQPEVSEWFSGRYRLFNECTILTAQRGVVRQMRPDRVMCADDKTVVVDFKTGQPRGEHKRQVGAYIKLLKEMGFPNVEGWLWYVTLKETVRV